MTAICVAQREIGGGRQELVLINIESGSVDVLVEPTEEWTYQAPKMMPDGTLMAYRLRPGQQFNIDSASNELVMFDGPGMSPRVMQRPSTPAKFLKQNAVVWLQHGHATPTHHGTLIHAVNELETWWLFGWPVRKQWVCVETDLTGNPTGARWPDQAEPSWSVRGLTRISTAGTGAVIAVDKVFDKATAQIGSKSWGWFDPHLSPDGSKVVWLDLVSIGLGVTSGLIIGDIQTGRMRYLVTPTVQMQTDAMWVDNNHVLGSRYINDSVTGKSRWMCVVIDMSGNESIIPNTDNCTAVHVMPG